jgi:DNA repair protein RadD
VDVESRGRRLSSHHHPLETRLRRRLRRLVGEVTGHSEDAASTFGELLLEHSSRLEQHAKEDAGDDVEDCVDAKAIEVVEGPSGAGLFDYQADLVRKIQILAGNSPPNRIGLVGLPTGSGKTRMAATACLQLFQAGACKRVLWVAPTNELLEQAISAFKMLVSLGEGPHRVSLVRAVLNGDEEVGEPSVVFASCQLLARRWNTKSRKLPALDVLVFDEAHQALAPAYMAAVKYLLKARPNTSLIGLTATPGRRDEAGSSALADLFGRKWLVSDLLGTQPLESLRQRGILANLTFRLLDFDGMGPGTRVSRKHKETLPVNELCIHEGRFRAIVEAISSLPSAERAIVFAGSLDHASALAAVLGNRGVASGVVSGYQNSRARRDLLDAFQKGEFQILINKSVLIAGYDCPAVKHVILTVPVWSAITFEQMVGRGCRGAKVGGNKEASVWSLDDLLSLHGPPSSYSRFKDHAWSERT